MVAVALAMRHRFGVIILLASIALAVAVRVMPGLELWSGRAWWMFVWGVLAYAAVVIIVRRSPAGPTFPELSQLRALQHLMEKRLSERRASEGSDGATALTRLLSEAISQLDLRIAPGLTGTLKEEQRLASYLAEIESGRVPKPAPQVLADLRQESARKRAATEECLQQVANAAAKLEALLQKGVDESVADQARLWAEDLLDLAGIFERIMPSQSDSENAASRQRSKGSEAELMASHVQDALRRLNEPAALSRCELISHIPRNLAAALLRENGSRIEDVTPLKQSQALREVLCAAIEALKPSGGGSRQSSPEALQYNILHEAYVRGNSTASIIVRHSISESTFHRNRREAIAVLARELLKREELLRTEAS